MIYKVLSSIALVLLTNMAQAQQVDMNHEITQAEIDKVNSTLSLIGKELTNNCAKNDDRTICLEDVKKELLSYAPKSTIRVIKFNSMVTMDFSFSRINIELDINGRVNKVSIG